MWRIWLFAQQSSDPQYRLASLSPAGLLTKNLHTSAALRVVFFVAKACRLPCFNQMRVLNKKPEMAPAER
ncbi:hypothetical protein ASU31_10655 [Pedobacter ginsenosidimutans]|uniref:Uncharacterized protein n=1 Tax=Pedobacter ginsenosidimutans TaxID=687842 RepID=A0A0T5VQ77_9SPHI|nr:hypothetical protein ASU31_10655 [Pedobacter ginsenosidimutans]